jgi:hypothetical protein
VKQSHHHYSDQGQSSKKNTKMNMKTNIKFNVKTKMNVKKKNLNENLNSDMNMTMNVKIADAVMRLLSGTGREKWGQLSRRIPDVSVLWQQSGYQGCGNAQAHIW